MSLRAWPGLAAIGAGLIHLGLAASSRPALLLPLVLVGAAEVLWGVAALARTPPPAGRVALLVAALVDAAGLAALVASELPLPAGPTAGALALDLVLTALLAAAVLRGSRPAEEPGALRFLLGTAAAAAVVALVSVSSLAGTAIAMRMH